MFDKILNSHLNAEMTGGKRSISDVQQRLEFTFLLITFARLLLICLLNLINIFLHISSNTVFCTFKKSMRLYILHICLIKKIIIVFPSHVFLKTMFLPKEKISCASPQKKNTRLIKLIFRPKKKILILTQKITHSCLRKLIFQMKKFLITVKKKHKHRNKKKKKKSDFPNEKVFYNYQKKQFSKEKISYTCLKSLFFKMIKFLILA